MTAAPAETTREVVWPDPDTPILRSRPVRPGTEPGRTSRFADERWRLQPAHPDAHHVVNDIRWRRFPAQLVPALKAFTLAALDHPFPPELAAGRTGELPNVATIQAWVRDLRVFAEWTRERGVGRLDEIIVADLDSYRADVLSLSRTPGRKAGLFNAVRALWAYRGFLPPECRLAPASPWDAAPGSQLAKAPRPGRVNKTPRIAPATMQALLAWALLVVEDIGPDVREAWTEYRQLNDGTHALHPQFHGLPITARVELFLKQATHDGTALPGHYRDGRITVNWGQLRRILGYWSSWTPTLKTRICQADLPVVDGSPVGTVTGRVHGRPWRDRPITAQELPTLIRVLSAACFVVTCYLSGMRPGEVLNLERGCADTDEVTGELLVQGRDGKGRNRSAAAEDILARTRPWVVVEPVHTAVAMMESLTSHRFLFPASIAVPGSRRHNEDHARASPQTNLDIDAFITWVNTTFGRPDGSLPIPPDPAKHVHASRLRRTLAYFIVRRPRGLVAAALQYSHISTKVTLSYSGNADTSWTDDLAAERLEMVLDQTDEDWTRLQDGEHISGPAAAEYRSRLTRVARFAGRVVNQVRNAERLLTQADPNIHHGQAMTCVWRAETAACRKAKLAQGLPADEAPDETECRSCCPNLAYTDRDIDQLADDLAALEKTTTDPLVPHPIRDRAAAQAAHRRTVIERHEQSRQHTTGPHPTGTTR